MSIYPDISSAISYDAINSSNVTERMRRFDRNELTPIRLGGQKEMYNERNGVAPVDSSALASAAIALQRVGVLTTDSSKLPRVLELVRDVVINAGFFGKGKDVMIPVIGLAAGVNIETAYARSPQEAQDALTQGACILRTDGRRTTCITELREGLVKEFDPFLSQSVNIDFLKMVAPYCVDKPGGKNSKAALIIYQPHTPLTKIRADSRGTYPRRSISQTAIAEFI